jgi:ketosteroid isomerase-like protein
VKEIKEFMVRVLLGALIAAVASILLPANAHAAPPFRPALQAHLTAISTRNMDALLPTITTGKNLPMIAPNGFKFDTRQQYVDFHRQWFASKDEGKLEPEIVSVVESPAMAHALIKSRYTLKDAAGKTQSSVSWLTLTFALESGVWRLVFDQNTAIDPSVRQ